MDWRTFIVQLGWQHAVMVIAGAAVIIVAIMRIPLGKLITGLTKIRYKNLEAQFSNAVAKVQEYERETAEKEAAAGEQEGDITKLKLTFATLAASQPEVAITTIWGHVLAALKEVVNQYEVAASYDESGKLEMRSELLAELQDKGLLDRDRAIALSNLNLIHHRVSFQTKFSMWTHPSEAISRNPFEPPNQSTPEVATTFVAVAFSLIEHFRTLKNPVLGGV